MPWCKGKLIGAEADPGVVDPNQTSDAGKALCSTRHGLTQYISKQTRSAIASASPIMRAIDFRSWDKAVSRSVFFAEEADIFELLPQ